MLVGGEGATASRSAACPSQSAAVVFSRARRERRAANPQPDPDPDPRRPPIERFPKARSLAPRLQSMLASSLAPLGAAARRPASSVAAVAVRLELGPRSPAVRHLALLRRPYSSSSSPPAADNDDPLHYHPLPPSNPRRLALSFLPSPPPSAESHTIVGFLPLPSAPGARGPTLADFVPNDAFRALLHSAVKQGIEQADERIVAEAQGRGEGWINLTGASPQTDGHPAPRSSPGCSSLRADALARPPFPSRPMADDRNPGLPGRVGDADDLIGSFYVRGGQVRRSLLPPPSRRRADQPRSPPLSSPLRGRPHAQADPSTYAPMPTYRLLTADGPPKLPPSLMARLRALLEATADAESRACGGGGGGGQP